MFFAFHNKTVIVDVQTALLAQGTQVQSAMQCAIVVEVKVNKWRA
tara:strand:+ start:2852 stop:2986 length:135 start_codon:yes stop_codon:yes gene_type:complete